MHGCGCRTPAEQHGEQPRGTAAHGARRLHAGSDGGARLTSGSVCTARPLTARARGCPHPAALQHPFLPNAHACALACACGTNVLSCALHGGAAAVAAGRRCCAGVRRERCALLRSCRNRYFRRAAPLTRPSPGCRAAAGAGGRKEVCGKPRSSRRRAAGTGGGGGGRRSAFGNRRAAGPKR